MLPAISHVDLSLRRSRIRVRILYALGAMQQATLARIAAHANSDIRNIRAALRGAPPRYDREHALLRLGLVREVTTRIGFAYELTGAGRRVLAALRSAGIDGR